LPSTSKTKGAHWAPFLFRAAKRTLLRPISCLIRHQEEQIVIENDAGDIRTTFD